MGARYWRLFGIFALAACQSPPVIAPPRSFERATRAGFACLGVSGSAANTVGAMSRCDVRADGTLVDPNYLLHAFVIQTERGEVGAVELRRAPGVPTIIDSNTAVPGFTFLSAGEAPSDIAVANRDDRPSMVYVASRAGREIRAIPTLKFRRVAVASPRHSSLALDAAPDRIALSPDQRFLYAALAEAGTLLEIPLDPEGGLGTPRRVSLATAAAPARRATSAEPGWERICLDGSRPMLSPSGAPTQRTARGASPQPFALLVAPGDGGAEADRLFVSDGALGLLHTFPISGAGIRADEPIDVGAPISEIAVTPRVPSGDRAQQYLYAIDRWDGSLLVVDVTQGSPAFGAIQSVDLPASGASDRVHFPARAVALEVVTPFYDAANPSAGLCATTDAGNAVLARPGRLRGVFVTAALSDATVRVVDVLDLDAPCRGPQGDCGGTGLVGDVLLASRRHRPRIGTFVSRGLVVTAQSVSNGIGSTIQSFGATIGDDVPELAALGGCPAGTSVALGNPAAPILCVGNDPWVSTNEVWSAVWEGALPRSAGTGRFAMEGDGLSVRLATQDACDRGVMSAEAARALPAEDPEGGYGGDVFVVTSSPTLCSSRPGPDGGPIDIVADAGTCQVQAQCAVFQRVDARGRILPARFPILSAAQGALRLGSLLDAPDGEVVTAARVRECFPGLLTYDVRARAAWAIAGDRSLPRHRVVADSRGACVVDATRFSGDVLRAFDGRPFYNGVLSFQASPLPGIVTARGAAYVFGISNAPPDLAVDAGRLLTDLSYVPGDRRLFAVDSAQDGLVAIALDTFTVSARVP